jgi:predicted nucleotidyltransferase
MKKITDYQFFKKLAKLPFVEEIWLFGSRSRGDNRDRSDIKSIYFPILQATFVKLKEKAQAETDRISIKP